MKRHQDLMEDGPRIQKGIKEYADFMDRKALKGNRALTDASVDVLWLWQLHKVHPVTYINDCIKAYGYVIPLNSPEKLPSLPSSPSSPSLSPTINFVQAVNQQRSFIKNIEPFYSATDENLIFLGEQYEKFLKLIPHVEEGKILVPTTGIDLMWHTHMMLPERYAQETKEISGRVLDHDDTLSSPNFTANLDYTAFLWNKHYKEEYLKNKVIPQDTINTNQVSGAHVAAACAVNFTSPKPTMTASTTTAATETSLNTTQQDTNTPTPITNNTPDEQTIPLQQEITWNEDSGSTFLRDIDGARWGGYNNNDTTTTSDHQTSSSYDSSSNIDTYNNTYGGINDGGAPGGGITSGSHDTGASSSGEQ